MLKMVPDPPHTLHSLEDTLLDSALIQAQMPNEPRTLH